MAGPPTFEQGAILVLLLALMVVFALDRFRIELVALAGLAMGVAAGLVPSATVFDGFSSPAVITVAEILLIIQALAHSRIVERLSGDVMRLVRGETGALAFLCAIAAFLSVFMNNIGALALILPVAVSLGARLGIPIRRVLMPVSFATLLGGACSLVGTPANLVVSQVRAGALGAHFAFFDLAYTGIPVALAGIAFLVVWSPRRFANSSSGPAGEQGIRPRRLVTEVRLPEASALVGEPGAVFEERFGATLFSVVRDGQHVFGRAGEQVLEAKDILVVEMTTGALEEAREAGAVEPADAAGASSTADVVLMPQSIFVGSRVGTLEPLALRGIAVTGVVSQRPRVEGRLADVQLAVGDVLVLSGPEEAIQDALDEADLLRLSPREAATPKRGSYLAVAVFALGVFLAAFGLARPEIAFGLAVLVLSATGALRLREGFHNLNWPILVMLAAMIPLGGAVETTGAAQMLSHALLQAVPGDGPAAIVACMLLVSVVLTPFVNNVSTAVVLAPIALEVARQAAMPADPLLIAVAVGASLDFLTPFGHHNNTLVMGIAGYRFADFPRLGLPLLLLTLAVAFLATVAFWL